MTTTTSHLIEYLHARLAGPPPGAPVRVTLSGGELRTLLTALHAERRAKHDLIQAVREAAASLDHLDTGWHPTTLRHAADEAAEAGADATDPGACAPNCHLREAVRAELPNLGGKHAAHFDRTGGAGSGCHACHETRDAIDRLRIVIAAGPDPVNPGGT